jgi:hypothetical protein
MTSIITSPKHRSSFWELRARVVHGRLTAHRHVALPTNASHSTPTPAIAWVIITIPPHEGPGLVHVLEHRRPDHETDLLYSAVPLYYTALPRKRVPPLLRDLLLLSPPYTRIIQGIAPP